MKKLIYCAAALAAMIFAGSCQQENLEPVAQGNTVTYTVEVPGLLTKAIADGKNVDRLFYEVWKTDGNEQTDLTKNAVRLFQQDVPMESVTGKTARTSVTLNLVQNQNYTILFWAQCGNAEDGVYNVSALTNVQYKEQDYFANNENYAAFYGVDFASDNTPRSKTVLLKRPFAQLNIGTLNTVNPEEYTVQMIKSSVVVSKVPAAFNVATSEVSEDVIENFEFKMNETENLLPSDPNTLNVSGDNNTYEYVAMNYIFAGDNIDVTYTIETEITPTDAGENPSNTPATISKTIRNVPVKENYRTNIVGNLLTNYATYNVVVDADFAGEHNENIWDGKSNMEPTKLDENTYEISHPAQLAWLAAAVNGSDNAIEQNTFKGKTFVLANNIQLGDQRWTPIGATGKFEGTFDGKGKTIYGLNVAVEDKTPVGLFANAYYVTDLTVENAVVIGHYKAGVIVGDGLCTRIDKCHVKHAVVTVTPLNEDDGNMVGGIVGYLSGEPTAFVKDCSVEDAEITAYRDVAGIAGIANKNAVVSGNTVKNVTVIADQTVPYCEQKVANADEIVRRKSDKAVIENNTAENTTAVVKVNTADNAAYQADNTTAEVEIVFTSDIEGNITIKQAEGKDVVINGDGNKFDGTILINGDARANGAEALTFKNINFETSGSDFTFISAPSKIDGKYNYSHNVTIEQCSFTGNQTVGSASLTGTYNFNMKNCAASNMHSLLQIQSCDNNVAVDGVTVENCKSGISLGNVASASVKNAQIAAAGYGIRLDGAKERTVSVNIVESSISAFIPVTVRKMNNEACNVSITVDDATALTGNVFDIAICKNEYESGVNPEFPLGKYNLTGTENFNVYPVADKESLAAALNNTTLPEIDVEDNIESAGEGFEVKRDVELNFNNHELNAGSTANSTWYAIEAFGEYNVAINDAYFTRAGVYAEQGANVVFNSGVINHNPERTSRYIFCAQSGSTITIIDGTFKNDRAKNSFFWADNATIYVKGGNFGGSASNKKVVLTNGGKVIITGGTFNFDPTNWLDEGYVAIQNGSVWEVAAANLITDAASFEAALTNGNDGDILVLAPGTYNGTFAVKRSNITIKGTEGVVVDCINLNGQDNVTIKNITFDAARAARGYDGSGNAKQYANIISGDNTNKPTKGAMNLVIDGCTFAGTFANGGASIAFTDQSRSGGGSGNITIKNCTFETENAYYNIYGHYTGNGQNGYGDFVIENNTFNTTFTQGGAIYLGRYASSTPVVVTGNTFNVATSLEEAMYVQDHSNYGVSIAAENNTFAN